MLSEESCLACKSVGCNRKKTKQTTPHEALPRKGFCGHRVGATLPTHPHPFWSSRDIPVALKTECGLYY